MEFSTPKQGFCLHSFISASIDGRYWKSISLGFSFLKTRSGSLSVWPHNKLFILIKELVKHPLFANEWFLLALSLKVININYKKKIYILNLALNLILNYLLIGLATLACAVSIFQNDLFEALFTGARIIRVLLAFANLSRGADKTDLLTFRNVWKAKEN